MEYRLDTIYSFHSYLDSYFNPGRVPVNEARTLSAFSARLREKEGDE